MYQEREFGNGTLTQRHPRDDLRCNHQVTIDFTSIQDDDFYEPESTLENETRKKADPQKKTMKRRLKKSDLLTVLLLASTFYLQYLCYMHMTSREPSSDNLNIDASNIKLDIDSDNRVKVMTYRPLSYKDGMLEDGNSISNSENDKDKYHKIWVWANASMNSHELFPDTPDVDLVLEALRTAPIIHVEALGPAKDHTREQYELGTAEKWLVTLEGGQKALVKLAWEEKKIMKENAYCNYGFEMPWSEVAAFHLHRVLGFRNTPYVVGRKIDLAKEIIPHATAEVKAQMTNKGGFPCVTGKCHFCKETKTICPPGGVISASVAYWVPRKLKLYTYPPNYMPYSTPSIEEWSKIPFNTKTYCDKIRKEEPYNQDRYFHDLFDFAVVDFMSYHFDSKHYILEDETSAGGLTVRLDHGRAFCASDRDDEKVFLAPIRQCCTLRWETLWQLQYLMKGTLKRELKQALAKDKTWGVLLHDDHLVAMERRLQKVIDLVEKCSAANGAKNVFVG